MLPALIPVLVLSLIFANNAYAQEPMVLEQVTPNGKLKVQLHWPEVLPDQLYNIGIGFLDPDTNQPLDNVLITYDVVVLQNNDTIELYTNQNINNGAGSFEVVFPEDGTGQAEIKIAIISITDGSESVQLHEVVSFNVEVVPEFSTLAAMVTGFSIAILLVLNKFKTQLTK